jgi:hypothetical protein
MDLCKKHKEWRGKVMTSSMINYLKAAKAYDDFFYMLYDAMRNAIPKAQLSKSGAYVWRAYRIDSYRFLAKNQYYCEIYHHNPQVLKFQESFQYKGTYRYFIMKQSNLKEEGFFHLSRDEQLEFLEKFVVDGEDKAIRWQISTKRKEEVPKEFQNGTDSLRNEFKESYSISRIPEEFLEFLPLQDKFFSFLVKAITKASKVVLAKEVSLLPNASWFNWDFRGYRMKFITSSGDVPEGPSDYTWRIYYKEPNRLQCEYNKTDKHPRIHPFIMDGSFLTSSEEEQAEKLYQYATEVLRR